MYRDIKYLQTCSEQQNQVLDAVKSGIDMSKIPSLTSDPRNIIGMKGWFKDMSGFSNGMVLYADLSDSTKVYIIVIFAGTTDPTIGGTSLQITNCSTNPPTECKCVFLATVDRAVPISHIIGVPQSVLDEALATLPVKDNSVIIAGVSGAVLGFIASKFLFKV